MILGSSLMPKTGFMKLSEKNYVKITGTTDILPKVDLKLLGHIMFFLAMTGKCLASTFIYLP